MSAEQLREEALALPLDERAALAKDLLVGVDEDESTEPGAAEGGPKRSIGRARLPGSALPCR
jgi:hypothetical protein